MFRPGTAPETGTAPAAGALVLSSLVVKVSGWPALLVWLTWMNHDQSPFLLPSEALAWLPP